VVSGYYDVLANYRNDCSVNINSSNLRLKFVEGGIGGGGGGGGSDTLSNLSCAAGQVVSWDGSAWVCADQTGGGGGGSGGGSGPSAPLKIEVNPGNNTTQYVCEHNVDLEEYCGDEDGCKIVLNMNSKTEGTDQVRTITEYIYMEESSFSSNNHPGTYGWTKESGGNGGDMSWITGSTTRHSIFEPWGWVFMYNYKRPECGGDNSIYADPYTFTFMTAPAVRAKIFVYDTQ